MITNKCSALKQQVCFHTGYYPDMIKIVWLGTMVMEIEEESMDVKIKTLGDV